MFLQVLPIGMSSTQEEKDLTKIVWGRIIIENAMGLGGVTVLMERTLQEAEKPTFLSPSCVFINSFSY